MESECDMRKCFEIRVSFDGTKTVHYLVLASQTFLCSAMCDHKDI